MEDIYSNKRIKEFRKINWKEAINDFENKKQYIMDKIKNISTNFDIPESEIFAIISKSTDKKLKELFIAVRLSKDPKRQNIYENIFYDYMRENDRDLIKLPSKGPNSIYLTILGLSMEEKDDIDSTKSLDFYEKVGENEIYYYNKYTEGGGGAQGSQFKDLQTFIRLAKTYCDNHQDSKIFVAVADGPFYDDDKLGYLAQIAGEFIDRRIFVFKWYDLPHKLIF